MILFENTEVLGWEHAIRGMRNPMNSWETMHKIHEKEFTLEDFSWEHLLGMHKDDEAFDFDLLLNVSPYESSETNVSKDGAICFSPAGWMNYTVMMLNRCREKYLKTKTQPMKDESKRQELMKKYWWQMIQLLPSSYNQKRTVMLNYEVLANIYHYRKDHKLDEWRDFCKWIESLPCSELITLNPQVEDIQ